MTTKSIASLLRVAALGLLLNAGLASGAIYRQHIDPPFWFGDGLFDVAPTCERTAADGIVWVAAGTGVGECGAVDILSLIIQSASPNPVGSITFAPPTLQDDFVTGLYWVNGVLTGIDTVTLFSVGQTGAFSNSTGYNITYVSGQAPESSGSPRATLLCNSSDSISTFSYTYPPKDTDPGLCNLLVSDGPATQEAAVLVPEPGSVALLLGAFGAGWLVRRRFRKA